MIKIYPSLFIGIGLALATSTSYAKPAHSIIKKHSHVPAKLNKSTSKSTNGKKRKALPDRRSGLTLNAEEVNKDLFERSRQHELIEPTTGNTRIHSLITNHKTNTASDQYPETKHHHSFSVHGIVNSSLTSAGQQAGLSNALIEQLTNIFAWDIDFATNLQDGDQFTVVYEKNYAKPGSEQIVAAEFVTRGKTYTAIRYEDDEGQIGYYSPEGKPMRKAFLSAPVDFIRISSGYDVHRKHPILNRIRAHKGVDYAARTGTPVKAAGDGIIDFRGNKGGYGRVVILKHGEHHETLYAHLANFKKGLKNGDHVNQGDIIGYVGQSGLATGPHLHYEFRVDGVHRNPATLNNQPSIPLSNNKLVAFKSQTKYLLAQLYQTKAKYLLVKMGVTPTY